MVDLIQYQHRISIDELKIEPSDVSRRLEQDILEYVWTMESPKLVELPIWAKHSQYVQNHITDGDFESRSASPCINGIKLNNSGIQSQSPRTPSGVEAKLEHSIKAHLDTVAAMATKQNCQLKESAKAQKNKSVSTNTPQPTRITKRSQSDAPHAIRTRSRKIFKFHELGSDDLASFLQSHH